MTRLRRPERAERDEIESLITAHFDDRSDYDVTLGREDDEFVRVAERDGRIVGVMAVHTTETRAALADEMYFFDDADPVPSAGCYGLVHMGYVRESETGRGIGGRLLSELHAVGRRQGVDVFVADAWFHGGPDSPERLLLSRGYEAVRRQSIVGHADGDCPKCGADCVCEAALLVRPAADGPGDR